MLAPTKFSNNIFINAILFQKIYYNNLSELEIKKYKDY